MQPVEIALWLLALVAVEAADCPAGLDGHLGGLCLVGPHDHLEVAVEIETGSLHTDGQAAAVVWVSAVSHTCATAV